MNPNQDLDSVYLLGLIQEKVRIMIKTFFTLILLTWAMVGFSQDTLVKNSGEILSGHIVETHAEYLTFQQSNETELGIIPVDQILLYKTGSSEAIQLYKNDTLILKTGRIVTGKVLTVSPESITYFRYNQHIEPIKELAQENILLIKFSNGTLENMSDLKQSTTLSHLELEQMAKSDALNYYRTPKNVVVGEVFLGLTSFMFYSMVAGVSIACIKPSKIDNPENPNNHLIAQEPVYKNAYINQAKKRKTKNSLVAFFSGMGASIGALIAVFALTY